MSAMPAIKRLAMSLACLASVAHAGGALARPTIASTRSNAAVGLACDGSLAGKFKPDAQTSVLLVKQYRKGDPLDVELQWYLTNYGITKIVQADLCMVKLLVGPGNPGPAGAPSTSRGVAIEIWLPAKAAWNGRVHAIGTGGWAGGEESDIKRNSSSFSNDVRLTSEVAAQEGAVVSSTDAGHTGSATNASFALNPDGSLNTTLLRDFSSRAIHLQAVMTKALATAYYGHAPRYSYFEGGSGGGRQALMLAQRYPQDYDGITVGFPAIHFTRFILASLYPQIVIQRDLGGQHMTNAQLDFVSNKAIAACDVVGGRHLGFILDPQTCRYDPVKDTSVLCARNGGSNDGPTCLTAEQATAINKFWYGMTSDGSVPDPAIDNGFGPLNDKHRWYGTARGATLLVTGSDQTYVLAADMTAVLAEDPKLATPNLQNAKSAGMDGWKALGYQDLSRLFDRAIALQPQMDEIDAANTDLSNFKKRGGKIVAYQGLADAFIPYQGTLQYVDRLADRYKKDGEFSNFFRFYMIPGQGHGPFNGTSNPEANPPITRPAQGEIYKLLTDWVEKGTPAPSSVVLVSRTDKPVAKSLPACAYPKRVKYERGDIYKATSYTCQ